MNDIEIIIKISEKEYNAIKEDNSGLFGGHIYQAIRNGRPLSEGRMNEEKWIPVTERLPREGVDVLVCNSVGCIYISYLDWHGEWYFSECCDVAIDGVIAWMPLPEPYKPESEVK